MLFWDLNICFKVDNPLWVDHVTVPAMSVLVKTLQKDTRCPVFACTVPIFTVCFCTALICTDHG